MTNRPTHVRWRVLAVLVFASFVSYVLRGNLSIAAPTMIEDLGVSEVQWGWVMASFTVGYALFQLPGGYLADRFGPRLVITVCAVLWAALTIVTSLVPDGDSASVATIIALLIGVRFLVGVTHAPIFPSVACSVMRWFPRGGWALPNGLTSTGLTLGFAACAPLLAWLVTDFGWRLSFIILSPLGLVAGLMWWRTSRDRPAEHPAANEAEVDLIRHGKQPYQPPPRGAWLELLKNRNMLLLAISYFCMVYVFYAAFNWFFYYLVTVRGLEAQEAGIVTSSQWIAGAAGAALGGWLGDRLVRVSGLRWGYHIPIVLCMIVSGVLLIGAVYSGNPSAAVVMLVLCFFLNQVTEGPFWGASTAIGGRIAGTAGGILNTGGNLSGVANAVLVPVVANLMGWKFAMALGGVLSILGAVLLLVVRVDRPYDEHDRDQSRSCNTL